MAFTQSCFIRKNTLELRKKLEELGYRYCSTFNKKAHYLWLVEGVIYDAFNVNILTIEVGECLFPYGISCGTNEELFLALAALRDDTNDYQWFLGEYDDGKYHPEENDSWRQYIPDEHWEKWWWFEVRKATVEEIIEHFIMKEGAE